MESYFVYSTLDSEPDPSKHQPNTPTPTDPGMPRPKRRVVDAFASAASFALCGVTFLVLGHWLVRPSGVKDGRFDGGATSPRSFVEYLSNECALMVIAAAAYLSIALLRQRRHDGAEGDPSPGREGGGGGGGGEGAATAAATAAAAATATATATAAPTAAGAASPSSSSSSSSSSLGSPLVWIASVRRRCGASLAVVVATVYFAQGFKSIASLALAIYMKDTMHLSPGVLCCSVLCTVYCMLCAVVCTIAHINVAFFLLLFSPSQV